MQVRSALNLCTKERNAIEISKLEDVKTKIQDRYPLLYKQCTRGEAAIRVPILYGFVYSISAAVDPFDSPLYAIKRRTAKIGKKAFSFYSDFLT